MNNIEELKPCPFCGGKAHLLTSNGSFLVECSVCLTDFLNGPVGVGWYRSEKDAAADWNDRPSERVLIAQLEAAERALIRPLPIGELIHRLEGQTYEKWFSESDVKDLRERAEKAEAALSALSAANNGVTAENLRVIKMLLDVCGTAFELADDSCQQDVDGELCHVVPDSAFSRLSDALGEIENTLPDEYEDLPNIVLQWAAIPRHALQELFTAAPQPAGFTVEGNADAE
ncbi:TPA: Lar family restriction alleviation protein [Yersinia enterocolitica]